MYAHADVAVAIMRQDTKVPSAVMGLLLRSGHLNPARYKQNKLRTTLNRMAQANKKSLPEGVSYVSHSPATDPVQVVSVTLRQQVLCPERACQ